MSEEKPISAPQKRRSRKVWIFVPLAVTLLLWLIHPMVLSWLLQKGLETWSAENRLVFSAEKIDARLDGPVSLKGVKFRSMPGSGLATAVEVSLFEWHWGSLGSLFSEEERFVRALKIQGLTGLWDLATIASDGGNAPAIPLHRWMPREIVVESPSLELLGKNEKWLLRNFALSLDESRAGRLDAGSLACFLGNYSKSIGPIHASTAWKDGTLWLADMELAPDIRVENLSLDFLREEGPALSLTAACFGGSLRSDLTVRSSDGTLDMAAWASNIPLGQLPGLLGIPGEVAGKLAEGRLTYRGRPDRPADAEASLRLVAEGFQWNKRGWESLEVGASLIHRRLVVTNFDLRQKENRVNFNGELSLAEGWSQISKSPFLVNFQADIHELGTLAGLLGGPLNEAAGRMTAAGSVSGHPGELDGFLSIEASDIVFRSLPPASLRMEAVFRKNEIDVAACNLFSRKDTASLRGTIGIASPHQYAAELTARIADLAVYLSPFHAPGAEKIYGGALDILWQGDGNLKAHSGAFDLKLKNFVSGITPAGLTGRFAGTYSPQNLYFSTMETEHGPLKLNSRATFASSGITLKDVELKTGNTPLLDGAAFLPIDPFAILGGRDWRAAIDPAREAYLRLVTPKELDLRSLLQLAGQNAPLEGLVRVGIEAGGPPAHLSVKGDLSARNLLWKLPGANVPPSSLGVKFSAADGAASFTGLLETKDFPPMTLSGRMPFGLVQTDSGDWQWANPSGTFDATLDFPRTDLAVFRRFLPDLRKLTGSVSGKLAFSGTIGAPRTNGRVELKDGGFEISTRTPPVTKTEAVLEFDGTRMRIDHFRGEVGAGPFQISGQVGLTNPGNPVWDLQLRGEKVLLMRDERMRLRANIDATLKGDNASGAVAGTVRFVDGRIYQRFEITPLLLIGPGESPDAVFLPPIAPGTVPEPFARWTLDLKIKNETPFLIQGNIAAGEIIPDVSLRGTLGQPVPVGRITLKDVQAFLPFTTMNIPEGHVDFLPDSPWIPLLDVRGTAQTPGFEVQAYAFGPLNEKKLILRSEPPLPQEALVLLLTTGIATDGQSSGLGLGEAAAGQGGLFLLRSFARQLDLPGVDTDALMNRLQIQAIPPRSLGERTTMRGSFRLFENFDLMTERDGYGFFNAGATYTWRFR